jgi:hypothetical protein
MDKRTNAQKLQALFDTSFFTEKTEVYFFGLGFAICMLFTLWFFPVVLTVKVLIALCLALFIKASVMTLKQHKSIKFAFKNETSTKETSPKAVDAEFKEK